MSSEDLTPIAYRSLENRSLRHMEIPDDSAEYLIECLAGALETMFSGPIDHIYAEIYTYEDDDSEWSVTIQVADFVGPTDEWFPDE